MAIVKKYLAKIEKIESEPEGIYTISFSSNKKFVFNPGQFLHLALDEYDGVGQWPESRCFSMRSSPDEDKLKITFAVKGNYTNRMANELKQGKEVWLKMPYGDLFSQAHSLNNCVFISGGTGITPYLSLFTDSSFADYVKPVLYFGARTKQYNIYSNDLEKAKRINPGILIQTYYEDTDGMLNIEKVFNNNGNSATYFISGPPIMIKTFKIFLLSKSIEENKIRTDEWE
ncbi:MAG: oxidoreductase FAD/NAD(P)-binding subunit [Ignavibacteria bacterium]|nr:MAG: oxidoreductase FAD/NAD(P)-binding subunit [Ignavibacteria bacterium]KAF0158537.1 MAG: oxidoreductase FAD/NAD(P)-binding subunit [Ignavibacteria bacterium]